MILSQTELIGSFNNINNYTKHVMGFNSQDVLIISQQDIPGSAPVDIFQESLGSSQCEGLFQSYLLGNESLCSIQQGGCAYCICGNSLYSTDGTSIRTCLICLNWSWSTLEKMLYSGWEMIWKATAQ